MLLSHVFFSLPFFTDSLLVRRMNRFVVKSRKRNDGDNNINLLDFYSFLVGMMMNILYAMRINGQHAMKRKTQK